MKNLDLRLLRFMRTRGHCPAAEKAAMSLSKTGENGYLWFGIGVTGALLDRRRRRQWAVAALLGPAAIVFNFGIKLVVRRKRPALDGLPPLGGAPSSLSFPSAHATASFACAVAMSRIAPELKVPLFGAAALMAVTRPYLGMHFPSDVAAGAVLGTAIGTVLPLPSAEPADPYDF